MFHTDKLSVVLYLFYHSNSICSNFLTCSISFSGCELDLQRDFKTPLNNFNSYSTWSVWSWYISRFSFIPCVVILRKSNHHVWNGNTIQLSDRTLVIMIKAFDFTNLLQWTLSNADTIGTTFACPEYRGVHILEASFWYISLHGNAYLCCWVLWKHVSRALSLAIH